MIAVFAIYLQGFWWTYHLQSVAKENSASEIRKAKPVKLIRIAEEEMTRNFFWTEAESEFSLNNKLYDIAFTSNENGQKIFYCLSDEKETVATEIFAGWLSQHSTESNNQQNGKIFSSSGFPDFEILSAFVLTPEFFANELGGFPANYFAGIPPAVIAPPPKAI